MATLLLAGTAAVAQQIPGGKPRDMGPRIGTQAPDFELRDQGGVPRTLSALLGPKGTMLVFYRSADW